MELIVITFCRFDFYVIKVTIHTKNYVEFESIYPLVGITGDYFSEDENFFDNGSIPILKKFISTVIRAYDNFSRSIESFTKYMEVNRTSDDVIDVNLLAKMFISINYRDTEFKYISQITKMKFTQIHVDYFLTHSYPFLSNFVMDDDVKIVENLMSLILEQNISKVVSINFHDDIYAGTAMSKIIALNEGHFPEEKLLQELFICYYSAPRLDMDKNPFRYDYFEKRFDNFTEDKKLGLFLVCNTDKELFIYNKFLSKFWLSRNKLWRIG